MSETMVDVQELQEMLAQGRPVTVLDVRQAGDYQEWAIPGSLHVDVYNALKAKAATAMDGVDVPDNRPIITI